jgi:hypothetical protein
VKWLVWELKELIEVMNWSSRDMMMFTAMKPLRSMEGLESESL